MSSIEEKSAVELLGGFRLTIHGTPVTNWRAGKSRVLFQYLLIHRDRVVTRDRLRDALWPHLPPSAGTTSVKAAVHGARSALRVASGRTPPVRICSVDGGYLLRADGLWIDLDAFTQQINAATAADRAEDRNAAAGHFRRAVALYRGPLLPEQDVVGVPELREWCRTRVLRALRYLGGLAQDDGDHWAAIDWFRRALEVDPYDSTAFAVLVECHRRLGLAAQALRWDHLAAARLAEV